MQAEQHLGKAEARIVDRDPVVAGERDLEAAAEAIAVDDRDGRQFELVEPVDDRVGAGEACLDARRRSSRRETRRCRHRR